MSTVMNLNAELLRELSYIADDESYLKKALKAIKKLVAQKEEEKNFPAAVSEDTKEYRTLTREEQIAEVNEMCEEIKQIRAGKLKGQTWEDFKREIHR